MDRFELYRKLDKMPKAAKIALIVTMLNRLDDIIETKGEKVIKAKAEGLKVSCNKIIDIAYEVAKED